MGNRGGGLVVWIRKDLKDRRRNYDVIATDSSYEQIVMKIESKTTNHRAVLITSSQRNDLNSEEVITSIERSRQNGTGH
ncbi:hypothetical protein Tcan_01842 [Toxocara canis]|uniref:Uncharacterized protein n=1 Tax=Toxocara canis TaxID=6265 RepID=A0A0B2VT96_TOXCA|nr:hypothetical protein Tcan_01842 [Toxocara canis]